MANRKQKILQEIEGVVVKPEKGEIRSKRTQVLLPPSMYKQVSKKCKKLGISYNECVNQLLELWLKE